MQIPEGYTPWFGEQEQPPISDDTLVNVLFRNGFFGEHRAGGLWWERDNDVSYEIVAYRKA